MTRPSHGEVALVIGGAGFIGTNVSSRLLSEGQRVRVLDSLVRPGTERNAAWLRETYGDQIEIQIGDVRDAAAVRKALVGADRVFHLAAQVAVTTSLVDPMHDFDVNLRGTLTLLEELRRTRRSIPLLYTSTNKVYGCLEGLPLHEGATRYEPADPSIAATGVSEDWPLQLASPYGCSKGGADQYVLEYARSFDLPTVVVRMSCIYGPHQMGCEDQGWVAHFLRRAIEGGSITLYGDGKQVRDILFVDDAVDAYLRLFERIDQVRGRAFNLGGGPENAISLVELLAEIARLRGARVPVSFEGWRASDQRYYVSDTRRLWDATGWTARVGARDGVERLHAWFVEQERGLEAVERPVRRGVAGGAR